MITNEDSIGYADILLIIFDDKCVEKFISPDRSLDFTFQEVLDIAKENGYTNGVIRLIAESPLNGNVYIYGNYDGVGWCKYGTTMGYA